MSVCIGHAGVCMSVCKKQQVYVCLCALGMCMAILSFVRLLVHLYAHTHTHTSACIKHVPVFALFLPPCNKSASRETQVHVNKNTQMLNSFQGAQMSAQGSQPHSNQENW